MPKRFQDEARRAQEQLDAETITPAESVALRESLDRALGRRRRTWVWLPAISAVAAAGIVAFWVTRPAEEGWYQVARGEKCAELRPQSAAVIPGCEEPVVLALKDVTVTLSHEAELTREKKKTVRLKRGVARFNIEPAPREEPFRVKVSHGTIVSITTLSPDSAGGRSGPPRKRVTITVMLSRPPASFAFVIILAAAARKSGSLRRISCIVSSVIRTSAKMHHLPILTFFLQLTRSPFR